MPNGVGALARETGLTLPGVVPGLMLGWVRHLGRGIFVPIGSAVLII